MLSAFWFSDTPRSQDPDLSSSRCRCARQRSSINYLHTSLACYPRLLHCPYRVYHIPVFACRAAPAVHHSSRPSHRRSSSTNTKQATRAHATADQFSTYLAARVDEEDANTDSVHRQRECNDRFRASLLRRALLRLISARMVHSHARMCAAHVRRCALKEQMHRLTNRANESIETNVYVLDRVALFIPRHRSGWSPEA